MLLALAVPFTQAEEGRPCVASGVDTIAFGELVVCEVGPERATQTQSFLGSPGDRVAVWLTPRPGTMRDDETRAMRDDGPVRELCLEVLAPDDEALGTRCGATGVRLDVELEAVGRHRVRLWGLPETVTQAFSLAVERLAPAPDRESELCWGCQVGESIAPVGDVDAYAFTAAAGERIHLRLAETRGFGEPCLELYGPAGALVEAVCEPNNPRLERELAEAGRYAVVVHDEGHDERLDYHLGLTRLGDPRDAAAFCANCAVEGSVALVGDLDRWRWPVTAGERRRLQVTRQGSAGQPCVEVVGPTGQRLASRCGHQRAQIDHRFDRAGTWTVLVSDENDDETLAYQLVSRRVEPTDASLLPLCWGCSIEASIDPPGEFDLYGFEGRAAEVLLVQLVGLDTEGEGCVEVLRPEGSTLASLCGASRLRRLLTLDRNGPHALLVSEDPGVRALDYHLSLERLVPVAPSTRRGPWEQGIPGRIDRSGDLDLVAFEGTAGTVVSWRLRAMEGDGLPCFEVYDPAGERLAAPCSPRQTEEQTSGRPERVEMRLALETSGVHTVVLFERDLQETLEYRLLGTRLSPPSPAVPRLQSGADPTRGWLDGVGDEQVYALPVAPDDQLDLRVSRGSSAGQPCVEVLDPSGKSVDRLCDPEVVRLPVIAQQSGEVTLVVSDEGDDELLMFDLEVDCRRRDRPCAASPETP